MGWGRVTMGVDQACTGLVDSGTCSILSSFLSIICQHRSIQNIPDAGPRPIAMAASFPGVWGQMPPYLEETSMLLSSHTVHSVGALHCCGEISVGLGCPTSMFFREPTSYLAISPLENQRDTKLSCPIFWSSDSLAHFRPTQVNLCKSC